MTETDLLDDDRSESDVEENPLYYDELITDKNTVVDADEEKSGGMTWGDVFWSNAMKDFISAIDHLVAIVGATLGGVWLATTFHWTFTGWIFWLTWVLVAYTIVTQVYAIVYKRKHKAYTLKLYKGDGYVEFTDSRKEWLDEMEAKYVQQGWSKTPLAETSSSDVK